MSKLFVKSKLFILTFLVTFPIVSNAFFISSVKAAQGNADVYILQLSSVGTSWFDNPSQAREGAAEASTRAGKFMNVPRAHPKNGQTPPFYSISYQIVADWSTYVNIISSQARAIVVNTHYEILPVPSGYSREAWIDKIAEAMTYRGLTWAHVAGYPFYYAWYQGASDKTEWGVGGFQRLMSYIGLGSVELWPPMSGEKATLTGEAEQYLMTGGWRDLNDYAYRVDLSRPLKKSDFADCTVLPLYRWPGVSEEYWEGAIIAFAKPGTRLDASQTAGFGSFVHLGTGQTYDDSSSVLATNRDYACGYVVTAAAIWREALRFESRGAFEGDLAPYPSYTVREISLNVAPVIAGYWWEPGGTFKVRVVLGLYGALKASSDDDVHTINEVGVRLWNIPDDCQMQALLYVSKNGDQTGVKLEGLWDENPLNRKLGLVTPTVLWLLPLVCPASAPFVLLANTVILFSRWTGLTDYDVTHNYGGVTAPASEIHFKYDPTQTYTTDGGYRYEELQSLIAIDMSIPIAGRSDWRVVPVTFSTRMFTSSGCEVEVEAGLSIAGWFDHSPVVEVFFEDFENDLAGWSMGDDNSNSGNDYWGISDVQGHSAWCAQIGDNSISGGSNVDHQQHDKDMNAYLMKNVDLRAFQSAIITYHIDYYIKAGDYLKFEYYDGSNWIENGSYTNGLDGLWGSASLPNYATIIRFRFISNNDNDVGWGAYLDNIEIKGILHNDADSMNDAPSSLTPEAPQVLATPQWHAYKGYLDSLDDSQDWYRFEGSQWVSVELTIPIGSDIYIELRNAWGSLRIGPTHGITYLPINPGTYYLNFSAVRGFGQYTFRIQSSIYSGGGCPYISTWNGTQYFLDNNLMPAAERSQGSDVTDYYMLQQMLAQKADGTYSVLLSEFENEHDFVDRVQLIAVDHLANVSIAASPYGEIFTYTTPSPPVSAIDNENRQVKDLINSIDGTYYAGYNGSYIDLNFGELDVSKGAKLLIRSDPPDDQYLKYSIHIQVQNADNSWNDVATIIPRRFWSTDIIDMLNFLPDAKSNLKVRLHFTANHRLDFVGLDTSEQAPTYVCEGQLTSAIHTSSGSVLSNLLYSDDAFAELVPGQSVELTFTLPLQTLERRNYIIIVEGHYYTI